MKRIVFCGGGSAGHVMPNIALIEDLMDGYEIFYIGSDGIERDICKNYGVKFYKCGAVKFVRGKILCNLAIPFKVIKYRREAEKILNKINPDLLFCKGGYVCVPPALAAFKLKIPVITHESDISAGLANKFIAKKCVKVLTAFPSATADFDRAVYTGTPMRRELFNRSRIQARDKYRLDMRPTVLVLGGGNGSRAINENIRKIAASVCKSYNILHICGKGNSVENNIYGYRQVEFENDMGLAYACADVAVSRCGSNAANELIALKIPSLFIPLANKRSRGDQIKNAEYFKNSGLCRVLNEKDLNEATLTNAVNELFCDEELKKALRKSAINCGNDKIVREIVNTMNGKR